MTPSIEINADASVSSSIDLWGKHTTDLQENIVINENAISGTLKYVADYSSAFGTGEDSGNYICLHFDTNIPGTTIVAEIINGTSGPVTLDSDGILVGRIANKDTQTISITASKSGYTSVSRVFTLTGLTCNVA